MLRSWKRRENLTVSTLPTTSRNWHRASRRWDSKARTKPLLKQSTLLLSSTQGTPQALSTTKMCPFLLFFFKVRDYCITQADLKLATWVFKVLELLHFTGMKCNAWPSWFPMRYLPIIYKLTVSCCLTWVYNRDTQKPYCFIQVTSVLANTTAESKHDIDTQ